MKQQHQPLIALVGPTGIGKTTLSLELARHFGCEIISVDSMQVYRHMDIGTAKIRPEEMAGIPHHCLDLVNPDEEYDAARFVNDAGQAIDDIRRRNKRVLLTGGTGLYLQALLGGLFSGCPENPDIRSGLQQRLAIEGPRVLHEELSLCDRLSAERISVNDSSRIIRGLEIYLTSGRPWSSFLAEHQAQKGEAAHQAIVVGLTCERNELYRRINLRTQLMIDAGLEGEVRKLLAMGFTPDLKPMGAIGYRHMLGYLEGQYSLERMTELLARDTRRYAKRQYTWFKRMETLTWFDRAERETVISYLEHQLSRYQVS